ncbi:chitinase [Rothia koreensis]|uniref:chitinase n=1 Tax=Rothia koreensis TaxID=592378 RepID=UPI003FCE530D
MGTSITLELILLKWQTASAVTSLALISLIGAAPTVQAAGTAQEPAPSGSSSIQMQKTKTTATVTKGADKLDVKWVGDQASSKDQDWGSGGITHFQLVPKDGKAVTVPGWEVQIKLPAGQEFSQMDSWENAKYDAATRTVTVTEAGQSEDYVPAAGTPLTLEWKQSTAFIPAIDNNHQAPAPFVPYTDMDAWPPANLTELSQQIGNPYFTTGFIQAAKGNDGKYFPAWGAQKTEPVSGNSKIQTINDLRNSHGDVVTSFGGAANQELAEVITDKGELGDAYKSVFDRLKTNKVDFDIEGAGLKNKEAVARRMEVLASLQQGYKATGNPLHVSFTLPVLPTGLTPEGLDLVKEAVKAGLAVDTWNVMAMDYGDSAWPGHGDMGDAAIKAGESLHDQLKSVYGTSRTDAQLWKMVGITPMLGVNDVETETFTVNNAKKLVTWANQHHIGRVSAWSTNRDNKETSKVEQSPYEFSKALMQFHG